MMDFFPDRKQHVMTLLNIDQLNRYKNTLYFDPMYGAGQGVLQKLLSDLPLRIESIHSERNPLCGQVNIEVNGRSIPGNLIDLTDDNLKKILNKEVKVYVTAKMIEHSLQQAGSRRQ